MDGKMRAELEKMGLDPDDLAKKINALFNDEATLKGIIFHIGLERSTGDFIMKFGECEW